MTLENRTIAFLGDSITMGYGLSDPSCRYATLVASALGMIEQNYGIAGTLVAQAGLNRSDGKDFVTRAPLIDGADVAVIFGGTNDYFWSDMPIHGRDVRYFEHAVRLLISHVLEKRQGKVTLFVTPYPHNGVGNFFGGAKWNESSRHDTDAPNYNGHTLQEYADVTRSLCAEHGLPTLDLFADFGFRWQEHTLDGCHPNAQGHALIANAVTAKLKTLL